MKTAELLNVIKATLPTVTWTKQPAPGPDTFAYSGWSESDWFFTVVSFSLADQGLQGFGYDGAARKRGVIVHLTPELAKQAIALAEAQKSTFKD